MAAHLPEPRLSSAPQCAISSRPISRRRPNKPVPLRRKGAYKSTALRWPFLLVVMVLLAAALVGVVALLRALPDSDNSAIVDGRPVARRVETVRALAGFRRTADTFTTATVVTAATAVTSDELTHSLPAPETAAVTEAPSFTTAGSTATTTQTILQGGNRESNSSTALTTLWQSSTAPATKAVLTTSTAASTKKVLGGHRPSGAVVATLPSETSVEPTGNVTATSDGDATGWTTDWVGRQTYVPPGEPQSIYEKHPNSELGSRTTAAVAPTSPPPVPAPDPEPTSMPVWKTVDTIVGASATTVVVTQARSVKTLVGVFGGHTTQTTAIDDGLVGETGTVTVEVGSSLLTRGLVFRLDSTPPGSSTWAYAVVEGEYKGGHDAGSRRWTTSRMYHPLVLPLRRRQRQIRCSFPARDSNTNPFST